MPRTTRTTWLPEQDAKLRALVDAGASPIRAAGVFRRTVAAIQNRARVIGRPFKHIKDYRVAKADRFTP